MNHAMPKPFDQVRQKLERQYLDVRYEPESGLSKMELEAEFEHHCTKNPDEPVILTRAYQFNLLCSKARIAPDPDDYFIDKLDHHNLMNQAKWKRIADASKNEFSDDSPSVPGLFTTIVDTSHTSPDWSNLLTHGFAGLRDRAASRSGDYYQAVALVYDGAVTLVKRFARIAPESGVAPLAERPPQTFREALQLAYIYNELQEMEGEEIRTMGRFDLLYNHFYLDDLSAGRLTRNQAKELLKYFWIKFFAKTQGKRFGKPFLFGPDVNELSCLSFEVFQEMKVVDPKFHVRLAKRTPPDFLKQVVGCIRSGCSSVVIVNDPAQIDMLCENGKTREDAENYLLIGCYEPAVSGKEMNWSGGAAFNLAKVLEDVLKDAGHSTFDELMSVYIKALDSTFTTIADRSRRQEKLWPQVNPSPFLSGTMDSCMKQGRDVAQGGAKYNTTGCICAGIANAADSLAVIRQLVFEDKLCTLDELKTALAANWKGYEQLRLTARNRVPKWGNNDKRTDEIARQITDFLGERINCEPNARGGVFQAALYAIIVTAKDFGAHTGALPDGRLAGDPLTMNTGASPGLDKNGVTSLINSVTKLNLSQFPSGTVLDIMLHPSATEGAEGDNVLISTIRSHFAKGGMAIQFNIFDADVLRKAQRDPEKYAGLQVRVCGWNVRFNDLSPDEQNIFIAKAENIS
jgi:formate C-acetyltransferase